jgi:hypothetical protein
MENDDDTMNLSQFTFGFILGTGLFGWALYKYPIFRREVIQAAFNVSDLVYDTYYQYRYDDKVRRKSVIKDITHLKTQHLYFNDLLLEESIDINCPHKMTLVNFFLNDLKYESVTFKDKTYYILGTKHSEEISDPENLKNKIVNFPWLSSNLEIITFDGAVMGFDITNKFKEFWIEHNQLPFHLEYYDVWISQLISNKVYPSKQEIKKIKLVIIDELGDFIEFSDVLIEPKNNNVNIINFPKQKEETIEEEEESISSESVLSESVLSESVLSESVSSESVSSESNFETIEDEIESQQVKKEKTE